MPGKHNAGGCKCCGSLCIHCDGTNPEYIRLEISGVVNAGCSDCGDYNTTTAAAAKFLQFDDDCSWTLSETGPCTGTDEWLFQMVLEGGVAKARLTLTNSTEVTTWETTIDASSGVDCCNDLDSLTLDYASSTSTDCDFSGSSVTIYAICTESLTCGCSSNLAPSQVEVTIAGISDKGCDTCEPLNATYVLDRNPGGGFGDCYYTFSMVTDVGTSGIFCQAVTVFCSVQISNISGTRRIQVKFSVSDTHSGITLGESIYWTATQGSDWNCITLDMDVPFDTCTTTSDQYQCTFNSSMTAHVRAA